MLLLYSHLPPHDSSPPCATINHKHQTATIIVPPPMAVLAITLPLSVAQHIMAQPLFASSPPGQHRATPTPSSHCRPRRRDIRTTSPSLINNQTSSRWPATTCFRTICFIVTLTVASERATKVHEIGGTAVSPRLRRHCCNGNWKTLLYHSKTPVAPF